MREHDVEDWSKKLARRKGWYVRKFKTPAHRSAPDDIFIKNGRVFFTEFKATGESPTELQAEEHAGLREHGATVYVCDSRKGEEKRAKHTAFIDILAVEERLANPSWDN